jgi:drug/metabolite transporter (DMT)-like permease
VSALSRSPLLDRPYLLLSLATASWALTAVAGRLAVGHVSPMAIVVLRLAIVLVALAPFVHRQVGAEWRRALPHWLYLGAMGAFGYALFSVFYYRAAHSTTAVNIGVIQGVSPALILLGGLLVYGERFGIRQAAGVAVTLVGVAIVACHGSLEVLRTLSFRIGDLDALVAALLYSGYTIALRSRPTLSPLVLFAAMSLGGFLVSLPLLAVEEWRGELQWPDAYGWVLVLFIGLVPSLLAQIFFMRGVALIGPGRAGLFLNLMPVLGPVFGVLLLGEPFAAYHAVGLAFVLGGIWLAETGRVGQSGP